MQASHSPASSLHSKLALLWSELNANEAVGDGAFGLAVIVVCGAMFSPRAKLRLIAISLRGSSSKLLTVSPRPPQPALTRGKATLAEPTVTVFALALQLPPRSNSIGLRKHCEVALAAAHHQEKPQAWLGLER